MKIDYNASLLFNSTIVDMWLIPFENWHLQKENFDISKLNFTWNCTSFEKKTLKFKLAFNNPLEISPLLD